MRRVSLKRQRRNREAEPARRSLLERVARCEFCGRHNAGLANHEILRGSYRQQALDKPFAILILCDECHDLMGGRSWAEQLAILRRSRPADFNLRLFHELAGRHKPSSDEVALWNMRLCFVPEGP